MTLIYRNITDIFCLEVVFTASGREDIDVKCLGKGRPFILEFLFPKKTQFTKSELKQYTKVRFVKI